MLAVLQTLFQLLGGERSSKSFAIGAVLGLGFSISVILATVGIMDGFESTLKKGLKHSNGDLLLHSRSGFFKSTDELAPIFKKLNVSEFSPFIRSEGFVIHQESSKGVQVAGIDPLAHSKVIGMDLFFGQGEVAIGKELAEIFDLKIGDELVLALPGGNREFSTLPLLSRYKVGQIITHGIYLKDLRIIYMIREELQQAMDLQGKANMVAVNVPADFMLSQIDDLSARVESFKGELDHALPPEFIIRPFWQEFSSLIEAVKVEKLMIGLLLQIIVVISIFNLLAFILFINEKRSKEIFLFKALGMAHKRLMSVWLLFALIIWVLSCAISVVFVKAINYALLHFTFLQLPGKIYTLNKLHIELELKSYLMVFAASLIWLIIISGFAMIRMKRSGIIRGLRQEFA